jgi:putative hydrolase of the HAD superfamily
MNAMIFDLDDTLIADEVSTNSAFLKTGLFAQSHYGINLPGFTETIQDVCRDNWHQSPVREYCVQVGISSWEGLWSKFKGADKNLQSLRNWAPTYRRNSWVTALQRFSIDDEAFALELAEKYIQYRQEFNVVYRDVTVNLKNIKKYYRLGLLTNGTPDLQRKKISGGKLGIYFDAILISGEFGIGKPDKRVFEKMLSLLEATPESAWMVGDNLKGDVVGAREAGIKAAWLNRDGAAIEDSIAPDLVVRDLDELSASLGL